MEEDPTSSKITAPLLSISDAVLAQDWKTLQRLADSDSDYSKSLVLSWKDKHGSSILHHAAGAGHLEMCQWIVSSVSLLEVGVGTTTTSKNGRTPLHWAARNGHTTICQFLVRTTQHNNNCPVDVLAKGDVTPLQLAVWQGHLQTCQVLVEELGADPHFVNGWGCGTAHWLGKCPNYQSKTDNNDNDNAQENNMRRMCVWLFDKCQVSWNLPNHHGQTPLHKAAFEGNLGVVQYLVWDKGVMDTIRDHQGNTAADCAERNQQHPTAIWLRKYASPLVHQALQILGIVPRRRDDEGSSSSSSNGDGWTETSIVPSISDLRARYFKLAQSIHPDRQQNNRKEKTGKEQLFSWSQVQWAYDLLMTYWRNPQQYDMTIRIATRNQALQERMAICWYPEWHAATMEDANITEEHEHDSDLSTATIIANDDATTKTEKLALFEQRLVRLLLTDAYRHKGLSLAQLPKEMKKTWNLTLNPKEYQCRKWIDLLQRKFHRTIHVIQLDDDSVSAGPNKQPRVFAKLSMPKAASKDPIECNLPPT